MRHKLDGHLRAATIDDLRPGHILRMVQTDKVVGKVDEPVSSAFPDHIVIRTWRNDGGPLLVELARPYLYVHLTGTTSPGVLAGCEKYVVHADRLVDEGSLFRLVTMSTGLPAVMSLDRNP